MRTMNKIVALSLVLAMALSMMASAASFKDQATINADLVSDINMMVALNVFSADGTGAGYFEPNVELTRAQVAKMVYVLKNKGVDNGATSWTGMNIFNDVEAGAWYEGYVNYCASVGMIAGVGNNNFNPNGKVTAVEFAKLLLVLNGYKADVEGYTGDKWFENIVADAENAGIFANYELPIRGTVTREWAAKLLNNAINVTMVKYNDGEAVEQYVTTLEGNETVSFPITFKGQQLGLKEYTGILVATPNISIEGTPANNEDGKNVYSKIDGTTDYTFKFDADPELLGQKVTVTVKGGLVANSNNSNVTVYGIVAHEDVVVADTTVADIKLATIDNNNEQANLTVNGVTKKLDVSADKIDVYVDYVLTGDDVTWANDARQGSEVTKNAILDGSTAGANDSRAVKLIDNNNDGIWDTAFINHVEYAKVEKITPAKNYIKLVNERTNPYSFVADTEEEYEDIVFVDTVAKDDIVKVTKDYSTGKELLNIELADTVTGVVTKVTSSNVATMDGTTYNKASAAVLFDSDIGNFTAGKDAQVFYTDGKFVVYYDDVAASTADQSNIAYVIKADYQAGTWVGESNYVAKVDILKNDGTRETLSYKSYTSNAPTGYKTFEYAQQNMVGNLVEFVMVDGKVYFKELATVVDGDLIVADATTAANAYVYDKSEGRYTATINSAAKVLLINDESYFFVKSTESGSTKYAVVLASELKGDVKVVGGTDKVAYTAEGLPYIKYGVLEVAGSAPVDEGKTDVLAIAAGSQTHIVEGDDDYWTMNVTNLDGTVVTLKTENSTGFDIANLKNKFVKYTISSDGNATVATYSFGDNGYTLYDAIEAIDGNTLMINGGLYTLEEDTKVYFVNSFKAATDGTMKTSVVAADDESAEIVVADKDDNNAYLANVVYKYNSDNELTHIIVEVDGEELFMNTKINN